MTQGEGQANVPTTGFLRRRHTCKGQSDQPLPPQGAPETPWPGPPSVRAGKGQEGQLWGTGSGPQQSQSTSPYPSSPESI